MRDVEMLGPGDQLGVQKGTEKERHEKSQTSLPKYIF